MYPQKMIEDSKDKVDVIRKRFPQWKNFGNKDSILESSGAAQFLEKPCIA